MVRVVTCSPILQELFQGFEGVPAHSNIRNELLAIPRLADPVPVDIYLSAAEIHRSVRQKGFTIRSAADSLIASIAIRYGVPVMHMDRDFDTIARFTSLRTGKL
jgi:predicted nucleic acid-binding protein